MLKGFDLPECALRLRCHWSRGVLRDRIRSWPAAVAHQMCRRHWFWTINWSQLPLCMTRDCALRLRC